MKSEIIKCDMCKEVINSEENDKSYGTYLPHFPKMKFEKIHNEK